MYELFLFACMKLKLINMYKAAFNDVFRDSTVLSTFS